MREKMEMARRAGVSHLKQDMAQRKTEITDTMIAIAELEVCADPLVRIELHGVGEARPRKLCRFYSHPKAACRRVLLADSACQGHATALGRPAHADEDVTLAPGMWLTVH